MSYININKNARNEDDNANSISNKQENLNIAIDMDMVQEKEAAEQSQKMMTESKNLTCADIENSIEPPADKNDDMGVDVGQLVDLSELKTSVIYQNAGSKRFTVMGMYDYMFGPSTQQQPPRFTRQVWRQEYPPPQPQQTMWTQYGPGQGYGGQGGYGGYSGYGGYNEYDNRGTPLMYDPRSRNSFVALVMSLVFVMLLGTACFLGAVMAIPDLKQFFRHAGWIMFLPALMGLMLVNYGMMCSPCARRPPCNFVMLIIATASMSIIAGMITSFYRTEIVLYAVIATGAVVFVCVLLACSKFDFTSYMLYIIAVATGFSVLVMIVLLVLLLTGTMMKPLIIAILAIGTLIQIVMLTMQLQMILGGKTVEMSEEDYALAAYMIYTSIIDIFMKMVMLLGLSDG